MKKYHVGKKVDSNDMETYEIFSSETVEADNRAFVMKVRDVVRAGFNESRFEADLMILRKSTEEKIIEGKINDAVVDITNRYTLNDTESGGILHRLVEGGDLSKWGLSSAVTRLANETQDFDRINDLERIGGQIIDLRPDECGAWLKAA